MSEQEWVKYWFPTVTDAPCQMSYFNYLTNFYHLIITFS